MAEAVPDSAQPQLSRWERKRRKRIERILEVTAQVLSERGYHNTSLDEIAERLDLAKASLYHYFESKEALVLATLAACAEEVNPALRRIAQGDGTAREQLREMIKVQVRALVADHPQSGRLFVLSDDWPEEIEHHIRQWRDRHDREFRHVISEGIEGGEFDVIDAHIARHALHGAMNHTINWVRKEQLSAAMLESIADEFMRLFAPVS